MFTQTRYITAGDSALVIEYGNSISEEICSKIRLTNIAIKESNIEGIIETVPTYRSLMVHYDPMIIGYHELVKKLEGLEGRFDVMKLPPPDIYEIPTLYGGQYGPDIENVARHNGLTVEEVIQIHTSTDYLIYMLGFTPGFPYLGGMDERIATPRLKTPRTKIPGGSVGIAGAQTGIYPIESPGGWQLIGRTPLKLYDPGSDKPFLLKAGNYVRFTSIDQHEFDRISAEVASRTYRHSVTPLERGRRQAWEA